MSKNKPETAKFKIYKIKEEYSINGMLDDIKGVLDDKTITYDEINNQGYFGLIYSNNGQPSWIKCIHELLSDNVQRKYQENKNMSYVLFKKSSNGTIYGVSGGQGYIHIKEYCEKNYGLNLIPKLINSTDDVVKNIVENRLYDNQIYNSRVNRRTTNFNLESDFTNLYKEFGLILDKDFLIELNLIDDNHFKDVEHIRFTNKDYIFIEKSLTFDNLEFIIDWLDFIDEKQPNFELNSFIQVSSSENYKPSEILELLILSILDDDKNSYDIEIVGEDIVDFLHNDSYLIKCDELNWNVENDDMITWNNLELSLKEKNLFNEDYLKLVLKKGVLITSKEGNETLNAELFKCLDCKLYDEKTNLDYFLLDGKWYYIDYEFEDVISDKFTTIYEESLRFSRGFVDEYNSLRDNWISLDEPNETKYNNSFEDDLEVMLFHPLKPESIEIADMIIYNGERKKLYLICIKDNFGYPGCRDLFGQIKGSYNYIKNSFSKNNGKITEYYGKMSEKNNYNLPISEEDFIKALNGNICFVAGFFNNFRPNPTLPIKILTNRIYSYLNHANVEFYIMNFNFDE